MISVGLVDDQALVRSGIATLIGLSGKAEVRWQAQNGQQALTLLAETPVDMLVSDIRMPVLDGIALVKALRAANQALPVLMLTTFDDNDLFLAALGAGANGFLLKDVELARLVEAIEKVAAGGLVAEPALVSQVTPQLAEGPRPEPLSDKEKQVLRLVAGGLSNKEIAELVFLAEGTVKNHLSTILGKLHCRDRTQAVLRALHWGLI